MKATFHCSTLEQAREAIRFAYKEGIYSDAEVVVTLEGEPAEVKWTGQGHGVKDDTVDAMLPQSFFGAVGTNYLNVANIGKRLAFKTNDGRTRLGKLNLIQNCNECLMAVIDDTHAERRFFLRFDSCDFVFLE